MAAREVSLDADGSNAGASVTDWTNVGGSSHHVSISDGTAATFIEATSTGQTQTFTLSSPGLISAGENVKFLSVYWIYGSDVTNNSGTFTFKLLDGGDSDNTLYTINEEWVAPLNANKTSQTTARIFGEHSSGTAWDATNLGNLKVLVTPTSISADKFEIHKLVIKFHVQGPHTGGYQGPHINFSRLEGDGHNVKILEGKTKLVAGKTMITDTNGG